MIRPEDLTNRAIVESPVVRVVTPAESEAEQEERSVPGEPCPPAATPAVEHGERTGGNPDRAGE